MPAFFEESNSGAIAAALEKIYSRLESLELSVPGELTVRVPAFEESPADSEPELVVGEGLMQYVLFDHASGLQYPPDLQPQVTPSKNTFRYRQLKYPERLFHISGEFEASGIQQVPLTALESYNTSNGTSFGDRPIDKIITPIQNTSGRDLPLAFICENDWINIGNGSVIDHVEPLFAAWKESTNEIELKFDRSVYSVPFGDGLVWDIKLSFWVIDVLDIE